MCYEDDNGFDGELYESAVDEVEEEMEEGDADGAQQDADQQLVSVTDLLDAQLGRSEDRRDFVTVSHNGADVEVKVLGKFNSSSKYILMRRDGTVFQAADRSLK